MAGPGFRIALRGTDSKWHATATVGNIPPDFVVWNHSVYKCRADLDPPDGYSLLYVQVFALWL